MLGRQEALDRFDGLDGDLWESMESRFPVRVTRSWADRVDRVDDPLGRQVFPDPTELDTFEGDRPDPVGERLRSPIPWVVQKHPDRVLVLVTRRCHVHCRYCFRRDQHGPIEPSPREVEAIVDFVRDSGAKEVILSGGDPLALSDRKLLEWLDALRTTVPVLRIHTRAPITQPSRVTHELVSALRMRAPMWILVHANHPDELNSPVREALARLVDAGLPVLNQSVLLRGVNDDVETLVELCTALVQCRVKPYYLHQTDPVPGNASLRVEPARGLALHRALARRVSGLALPRYVVDLEDGSGKVDVADWFASQPPGVPSMVGDEVRWRTGKE